MMGRATACRPAPAALTGWETTMERIESDANLIAAAPDLLAACKLAEQGLRELRAIAYDEGLGSDAADEAIVLVAAAIAKAHGE